mmetsp:Transcript_13778/g.55130  ORF Transcript_13778/g.55130 Transcript_13778/m.55130 type:complete len:226 (+) Transcript_13778:871-1548(+)
MQPWLAAHARNALSTTSVTRIDVSTLPAHTAASGDGASIVYPGVSSPGSLCLRRRRSIGSRQPELSGMSRPTRSRTQYMHAAAVTAVGAFQFPRTCGPVALAKSKVAAPVSTSTSTVSAMGLPSSMRSSARRATRGPHVPPPVVVVATARRACRLSAARTQCSALSLTWRMYAATVASPYSSQSPRRSRTPLAFAATWALRSDSESAMLRHAASVTSGLSRGGTA